MNKCVLIVDDDQEFLELLQGIFKQADYAVHTAVNAELGMEVLEKEPIELIITDQRLPGGISGSDFIIKIRERDANLPVIMISGYLDDDTIRELIRDGVEGVFIKPLNIFSLLKKASEIIEAKHKAQADPGDASEGSAGVPASTGSIGQIEGLSQAGSDFLVRARDAATFRRNLLLIGPTGTLFEEIARDLIQLGPREEHCVTLKPGQITLDKLKAFFEGEHGERPLALILEDAEKLSVEEVDSLVALSDDKGGISGILRLVFCLSNTVEELYDSEAIDEELYLFLGSNELLVPALKDMPEDLVAIAQKEVAEQCEDARIDMKSRSLLLDHNWPQNMLELRSIIVRAISLSQPLPPQSKHFEAAMQATSGGGASTGSSDTALRRFLIHEKKRYLAASEQILNS